MKKINLMLVVAITATIITTTCNAQLFIAKVAGGMAAKAAIKHVFFNSKDESAIEAKEAAKSEKAAARLTKANLRAAKSFNEEFNDQQNVNWYTGTEVISASFNDDKVQTTAFYDKSGRWLRTMKVYNEDQLPRNVRKQLKLSEYSNCDITSIQEFKEGDNTFYVVHLEDAKTYKLVSVCDGEMNLYKEYNKQL